MAEQPAVLVLAARVAEYEPLLRAALPDVELRVTMRSDEALRLGSACTVALADPPAIRPILADLPHLRWLQSTYAGVDTLLHAGLRRDYLLTNVRGIFGPWMAEYVICYALMHERLGWQRYRAQQERRWEPALPGTLRWRTLGILGVGSIGAEIARTAKFFGMRTLGYTLHSEVCEHIDRYFHEGELLALAREADYLVAALPGTAASRHLIDAAVLQAMPRHAVLMNVGRGSAVDEGALVAALQEGRIAAAVLDVFQQEPLPPEHPLWTLPNVVITSHTSALSFPEEVTPIFVANYRRYVAGELLENRVDFDRGY
jgi:phosphoglycerate dehydrogenase-like enzyme